MSFLAFFDKGEASLTEPLSRIVPFIVPSDLAPDFFVSNTPFFVLVLFCDRERAGIHSLPSYDPLDRPHSAPDTFLAGDSVHGCQSPPSVALEKLEAWPTRTPDDVETF